jgi:hypothetical protein
MPVQDVQQHAMVYFVEKCLEVDILNGSAAVVDIARCFADGPVGVALRALPVTVVHEYRFVVRHQHSRSSLLEHTLDRCGYARHPRFAVTFRENNLETQQNPYPKLGFTNCFFVFL